MMRKYYKPLNLQEIEHVADLLRRDGCIQGGKALEGWCKDLGASSRATIPSSQGRRGRVESDVQQEETDVGLDAALSNSVREALQQEQDNVHHAILHSKSSEPLSSLRIEINDGENASADGGDNVDAEHAPDDENNHNARDQHEAQEAQLAKHVAEVDCISVISAVGSEQKCYMNGASFPSPEGNFLPVESLKDHDTVRSLDGSIVQVLVKRHSSQDRSMVWLQSDAFKIPLTHNHRVMIDRGTLQKPRRQTIPAGHLRPGDHVLCAKGLHRLTDVIPFLSDDDVFEITFCPDREVETCFIEDDENDALLTKGKKIIPSAIKTRRGGMSK